MPHFSLKEIAEFLGRPYRGEPDLAIECLGEIQNATEHCLTFIDNSRYQKYLPSTKASVVILREDIKSDFPNVIVSLQPQYDFARLITMFFPERGLMGRIIHPTAVIDPTAMIGRNAHIGDHTSIGHHTILGDNVTIFANVTFYDHVIVGDNVIIHSGTVIGSDGFGFAFNKDHYDKIPQLGRVVIGNNVEIGANCTLDRGTIGDTTIGEGTKLDNLVHVAHNVKLGKHCVVAGQTGFAGSAVIEDYCVFGGQVAVNGHVHVGKGTQVAALSGVTKDIEPGSIVAGFPAGPINEFRKREIYLRKLSKMNEDIQQLKKQNNSNQTDK